MKKTLIAILAAAALLACSFAYSTGRNQGGMASGRSLEGMTDTGGVVTDATSVRGLGESDPISDPGGVITDATSVRGLGESSPMAMATGSRITAAISVRDLGDLPVINTAVLLSNVLGESTPCHIDEIVNSTARYGEDDWPKSKEGDSVFGYVDTIITRASEVGGGPAKNGDDFVSTGPDTRVATSGKEYGRFFQFDRFTEFDRAAGPDTKTASFRAKESSRFFQFDHVSEYDRADGDGGIAGLSVFDTCGLA